MKIKIHCMFCLLNEKKKKNGLSVRWKKKCHHHHEKQQENHRVNDGQEKKNEGSRND